MVSPLFTFHCLAVPSRDPLTTRCPSGHQQTDVTSSVCPVHLLMTLPVSTSHNLTAPSSLPLARFFPSGDKAIVCTSLSASRQSFPICSPLSKFHTRSEPSSEQVMIRCPSNRCMTLETGLYSFLMKRTLKLVAIAEGSLVSSLSQSGVLSGPAATSEGWAT